MQQRRRSTTTQVQHEVRMLATLQHPNLLRYIACYEEPDALCIVSEFAGGGNLRSVIHAHALSTAADEETPIGAACIVRWMSQLASALVEVHARRMVHRNIKPENIFLSAALEPEDRAIKIGDFALSTALPDTADSLHRWIVHKRWRRRHAHKLRAMSIWIHVRRFWGAINMSCG